MSDKNHPRDESTDLLDLAALVIVTSGRDARDWQDNEKSIVRGFLCRIGQQHDGSVHGMAEAMLKYFRIHPPSMQLLLEFEMRARESLVGSNDAAKFRSWLSGAPSAPQAPASVRGLRPHESRLLRRSLHRDEHAKADKRPPRRQP